jgi:hypothetical protein
MQTWRPRTGSAQLAATVGGFAGTKFEMKLDRVDHQILAALQRD